jgi:putative transposase
LPSHRVELPAIFELEHDCSVLEYYDQVPSIKLDYRSANGKRLGVTRDRGSHSESEE